MKIGENRIGGQLWSGVGCFVAWEAIVSKAPTEDYGKYHLVIPVILRHYRN